MAGHLPGARRQSARSGGSGGVGRDLGHRRVCSSYSGGGRSSVQRGKCPCAGPVLEPMRRAAHPSEPQPATASSTRPDALPRPVRRAPRGVPADTKQQESRHAAQNAIGFCVCSAVISEPSGPGLPAEPSACPFCESGSFGVTDGREEPAHWPQQPPSSLASTAPKGFHGLPPRA